MNYNVCSRCSKQEEERQFFKFKHKREAKKDLDEWYRQGDALQ